MDVSNHCSHCTYDKGLALIAITPLFVYVLMYAAAVSLPEGLFGFVNEHEGERSKHPKNFFFSYLISLQEYHHIINNIIKILFLGDVNIKFN